MIRKLALVLLGAAALVWAPAPVSAETDPAFAFYEKQAKEILRAAGDKIWGAADDARKYGFYQLAIAEAERALEFDTDQKDARDFLKYAKKEGKWVQDEEAFKRTPQQNVRPSNKNGVAESEESMQRRIDKWKEESLAKADKYAAARYSELGDVCAAKNFQEQARKGYEAALRLDKENEKARKGTGYTRFGKVWITKKQDEARKAASKAEIVKETEKSAFEDCFGIKLNKVETLHVRIESAAPVEELQGHCQAAETAYAYYLADFGMDPGSDVFSRRKAVFVIMTDEVQWNKFVDQFGGADKEFSRTCGGIALGQLGDGIRGGQTAVDKGGGKIETSANNSVEGRRDSVVHRLVHEMNDFVWHVGDKAWLDEGLAFYYTAKVLESTDTHCVSLKHGDYANQFKDEGGLKKWEQSDNWKPLVKSTVQAKNDVALRLVMSQKMHELQFDASVKAWSVCSYLMELQRDKFMEFLDTLREPSTKQVLSFQNVFGSGIEDVEKLWQVYVRRCY